MTQYIIFDLDGTLALDTHRVPHLREGKKDWEKYFSLCEGDAPNHPIIETLNLLWIGYDIQIWTGRAGEYETQTRRWLDKFIPDMNLKPDRLRMRPPGDRTDDFELKRRWLHELRQQGHEVLLVFEDRKRVVDMWRSEGVVCCQVAPGDF